jgi:hypothetical protein
MYQDNLRGNKSVLNRPDVHKANSRTNYEVGPGEWPQRDTVVRYDFELDTLVALCSESTTTSCIVCPAHTHFDSFQAYATWPSQRVRILFACE